VAAALAGFGQDLLAALAANYVNLLQLQCETTIGISVVGAVVGLVLAVGWDRAR
jgi:hypothetical protein